MSAGTGRDAAGVDGAPSWRAIHESLSRQRQHPSSPPSHAVAQERQSRAAPKPPPLPRSDYKIILRVRGGLNCAVIHPCVLRQIILKAAGLPISDRTSSDQIRVNSINHTVLISTPDLDRADLYHGIRLLNFNGTPHEVATHVADPVDTCRGTVLLPSDYSEDEIISTLRRCNPKLTIGGARRLGSTETILIIFQGKIVPYYVHYDGCALRCRPFRQKVEACTRCRQIGHRQDVCTNTSDTLCPKCGLKDAPMDHECDHVCVVCNGNHETVPAKVKIAVVAPIQRRKTTPGQAYHQALLSTTLRSTHTSEEQWEAALRSSRPAIQKAILEWAERVEEDYFK
ncbi:hypothetical protein HPB51_013153 [Rhipicephalus microplus]|uniref:Uncharacterized protein n=1 Tax=Rhipicephalus microplus TaxID=6941 RepID=A0A9J6E1H3_RHIMP|nr:hypothetical protein HPB51_013153 [Rhipicephalus microplus]